MCNPLEAASDADPARAQVQAGTDRNHWGWPKSAGTLKGRCLTDGQRGSRLVSLADRALARNCRGDAGVSTLTIET